MAEYTTQTRFIDTLSGRVPWLFVPQVILFFKCFSALSAWQPLPPFMTITVSL